MKVFWTEPIRAFVGAEYYSQTSEWTGPVQPELQFYMALNMQFK